MFGIKFELIYSADCSSCLADGVRHYRSACTEWLVVFDGGVFGGLMLDF